MTTKYITMNNRTYTVFFNNGSRRNDGEVSAMMRTANNQDRLVTNRVTLAKAAAIAIDVLHAEALEMDAAMEWAKITPEQRAIHDTRVTHGISLKNKYNTDDVLEACHAEALEMNALIPAVARAVSKIDNADYQMQAMFWAANDYAARRNIVEAAHTEALNMDAARELNARQARFVFHNTAAERAEAIEAAHAAALKMDANMKI